MNCVDDGNNVEVLYKNNGWKFVMIIEVSRISMENWLSFR